MPAPKYIPDVNVPPTRFPLYNATTGGSSVAEELAALRQEIVELRKMLSPPSAVILTGPEVDKHFARLADKP